MIQDDRTRKTKVTKQIHQLDLLEFVGVTVVEEVIIHICLGLVEPVVMNGRS